MVFFKSSSKLRAVILWLIVGSFINVSIASSIKNPIIVTGGVHSPSYATQGMVATQHAVATEVGKDILAQGGNAIDAAIATAFALAVVLPRAGNIGGGGFMVVHSADKEQTVAIDYREIAPYSAHRDMFLGKDGNADPQLSRYSHFAAGVPGTVAGMVKAHEMYGSMPWKKLLKPAIDLATKGFAVTWDMHNNLIRAKHLRSNEASRKIFYPNDTPLLPGQIFKQKQLAATLKRIQQKGRDGFYKGRTAQLLLAELNRGGNKVEQRDLDDYEVIIRKPIRGRVGAYDIASMPPPSSGGIFILQILKVLHELNVTEHANRSAQAVHLAAEAMRHAFADRTEHLGDPDFYDVPVEWLTSDERVTQIANSINRYQATDSRLIGPSKVPAKESFDTTHFSIVDRWGNAVANTYTLNFSFGSGIMVPGTGMLLNNEMDDFSAQPGAFNGYGLLGKEANAVQPRKRPLSSMSPTIVFKDGKVHLVTGSPGGSRIITSTMQHLMDMLMFKKSPAASMNGPRFHHQWLPDKLFLEGTWSPDTIALLKDRFGHDVQIVERIGGVQSIHVLDSGLMEGIADPRRPDSSAAGIN